jgi:phosphoribosylanthranilate isomerase
MALKTNVKVGSISNLSDARYCAGMGVQYLGFALDPGNTHHISLENYKTIRDWVVGPKIVGEVSGSNLDRIEESIGVYDVDYLEITHPEILAELALQKMPVILKMDISAFVEPEELQNILAYAHDKVDFFILEKTSDTGFKTEEILELASKYKIMIGYSIERGNVHHWLDGTDIYGIALKGSVEIKPGFKDYDELADILEELEMD